MGPPVDTTKDGRTICSHSKSFLVSFCNLGRWCSRYSLGVIDEELRQFSWVNADDFMSPKIDNGVTGIHVFSGGVLVCIQSPMPRVAWLDPDLRFRRAFRLMKIKDPHSITSFGREALIVCSQRNRLYSLDLDTGCESCVFTAERSCSDVVHLNGVALRDGHPIVSLFGRERPKKPRQGRVVDTETKKVLVEHIMEPHSPTVNEGILYVLGSATGELHRFSSSGTNVILLGGYVRGLAVTPNGILVGRSAWRAAGWAACASRRDLRSIRTAIRGSDLQSCVLTRRDKLSTLSISASSARKFTTSRNSRMRRRQRAFSKTPPTGAWMHCKKLRFASMLRIATRGPHKGKDRGRDGVRPEKRRSKLNSGST